VRLAKGSEVITPTTQDAIFSQRIGGKAVEEDAGDFSDSALQVTLVEPSCAS